MKKLFQFLLMAMVAIVFASCEKSENLDGKIGLVEGFKYCFSQTSYIVWLIVAIIAVAVGFLLMVKNYKKTGSFNNWLAFILIAILLSAIFIAPEEVGRNTTVEQAARGVYIR